MKPRIRPVIRYGFTMIMYRCRGPNLFGLESDGWGLTAQQAYEDWKRYYDFPF